MGDGACTTFWLDCWLTVTRLRRVFLPFSLIHLPRHLCFGSLHQPWFPFRHLSSAREVLSLLTRELAMITPSYGSWTNQYLPTRGIFFFTGRVHISCGGHPVNDFAPYIWRSFAPTRCKFFLSLCHRRRLPCASLLHYSRILPSAGSIFCGEEESIEH